MKKLLILFLCIITIAGCGKKEELTKQPLEQKDIKLKVSEGPKFKIIGKTRNKEKATGKITIELECTYVKVIGTYKYTEKAYGAAVLEFNSQEMASTEAHVMIPNHNKVLECKHKTTEVEGTIFK